MSETRKEEEPVYEKSCIGSTSTHEGCPRCGEAELVPEHAHQKCPKCWYIEPCCGW